MDETPQQDWNNRDRLASFLIDSIISSLSKDNTRLLRAEKELLKKLAIN